MTKEEIIENIKDRIEYIFLQYEIDAYIRGYLDALCHTYEITWNERYEIEEALKDE